MSLNFFFFFFQHLWSLRERVAESVTKNGSYCYKYDLSLKLSGFYDLVLEVRKRVSHIPNTVVMGYGHVGDSKYLISQCISYLEIIMFILYQILLC